MKSSLRFASLALGVLLALPLHAADVDPLWAKVVAQTEAGKKWVAKDVQLAIEGNAEGKEEKRKVTMQLTGWEKDQPIYKTVSIEPPEDPSKQSVKKENNSVDKFNSMSDDLIKLDAKVVRKDGQQVDGKAATVFVVDNSKGPMNMKMQVWVDPASGNIHKIQTHAKAILMLEMMLNIAFKPHTSGMTMPSTSELKMEVLIPFKGAKMHLLNTTSNWVQRPL